MAATQVRLYWTPKGTLDEFAFTVNEDDEAELTFNEHGGPVQGQFPPGHARTRRQHARVLRSTPLIYGRYDAERGKGHGLSSIVFTQASKTLVLEQFRLAEPQVELDKGCLSIMFVADDGIMPSKEIPWNEETWTDNYESCWEPEISLELSRSGRIVGLQIIPSKDAIGPYLYDPVIAVGEDEDHGYLEHLGTAEHWAECKSGHPAEECWAEAQRKKLGPIAAAARLKAPPL